MSHSRYHHSLLYQLIIKHILLLLTTLIIIALLNNILYSTSSSLLMSTTTATSTSTSTSTKSQLLQQRQRQTQQNNNKNYYYTTSDVGTKNNYDITLGNPLRGLASDPNLDEAYIKSKIVFSVEVFYFPFSNVVINYHTYNWTSFESILNKIANKNNHGIPRFWIDYPNEPLALPQYLVDDKNIKYYKKNGYISPYYTEPKIIDAIEHFIVEFGKKYDGDRRLAAIQMGLLGMWGEWHVSGHDDDDIILLPDTIKLQVLKWYNNAFSKTQIQTRYPRIEASTLYNFGYYDDSFTWYTLNGWYDGYYNGYTDHYFVPKITKLNITNFWKYGMMGGEVRPDNVKIVFDETNYPAQTRNHQDFYYCSQLTHSTYNKVGGVIGDYKDTHYNEYTKANWNSARMGYSFEIIQVSVFENTNTKDSTSVNIDVILQNIGIAPFYYPLSLVLNCIPNTNGEIMKIQQVNNIETSLIEQYTNSTISFTNVPIMEECFSSSNNNNNKISFTFESYMLYTNRPIKFAQGIDGTVSVSIPYPPNYISQPTKPRAPTPRVQHVPARVPSPIQQVPIKLPDVPPPPISKPIPTIEFVLKDVITNKEYNINNGQVFDLHSLSTNDSKLTLVAHVKPEKVDNTKIIFKWSDNNNNNYNTKYESSPPYAIGGNSGTKYYSINYLNTPGPKSITVSIVDTTNNNHDNNNVITFKTISFNIVNNKPLFKAILVNTITQNDVTVLSQQGQQRQQQQRSSNNSNNNTSTIIDLNAIGTSSLALRIEL